MENIDRFELMLMDSPINILELPDGTVNSILELMNKCYTTRNNELLPIFEWLLGHTDFPAKREGQGAYYWREHLRNKLANAGIKITTKLKEDKK